jgi:hypothetical protein
VGTEKGGVLHAAGCLLCRLIEATAELLLLLLVACCWGMSATGHLHSTVNASMLSQPMQHPLCLVRNTASTAMCAYSSNLSCGCL